MSAFATLPELQTVRRTDEQFKRLSERAHDDKLSKDAANCERASKAAATRRANELKRKEQESAVHADQGAAGESSGADSSADEDSDGEPGSK
eukprot:CAMPEP_0174723798 /NCGR_PEP_ID=MMETSP1094-20130205/41881_1 /TAXON_ID=156173 /ORGANISM="Chrysochromulina brevifilum, Strain UTEX LB 985" /LENGTH=91 /DNA_ID=CAMNT_0015924897 /DNA_START=266 /DNA_END=539 /DNA_ORIENTATION=+